jgi:ribonuclease Z
MNHREKGKSDREGSKWSLDRRSWLKGAGAGAGVLAASGMLPHPAKSAPLPGMGKGSPLAERKLDPNGGLSVVLLGTGTPLPNPDRACASTLVIAGDKTFLFDTGRGFLTRLADAGLNNVSLVLFTHYHSDHIGEFGEFLVNRTVAGADKPMPVVGPIGAQKVVSGLLEAYALDNQYRKAHHGAKWNEAGMKAEVKETAPGVIHDEAGVKITMFEVDHAPVVPAMGYRVDYQGQSVVVSGDTKKTAKMVEMAKACDLLVHESVNKQMTEIAIKTMRQNGGPVNERMADMAEELLTYHTTTDELAEIARDAAVKKLVMTHMAPVMPANAAMDALYAQGMNKIYKGAIVVGRDGMEVKA